MPATLKKTAEGGGFLFDEIRQLESTVLVAKEALQPEYEELATQFVGNFTNEMINLKMICATLHSLPLDKLPTIRLDAHIETFNSIVKHLYILKDFADTDALKGPSGRFKSSIEHTCKGIISMCCKLHMELYLDSCFLVGTSTLVHDKLNAIYAAADKVKSLVATAQEEADKAIQSVKNIAHEKSAIYATEPFVKAFAAQEKTCRNSASWWLIGTSALSIGAIVMAVLFYYFPADADSQLSLYQALGTRLLLMAILLSAAIWCAKIYKSLYNQALVNNHRSLSVQTLSTFLGSISEQNVEARDAIVLQATKALYSHIPTGFINDQSGIDGDVNIIGAVKGVVDKVTS